MNTFRLSNGMLIPQIGFGTYQATGDGGKQAIRWALEAGYRFFDTASLYGTEKILGEAVRESGIPREELILETKLWIDEMDDPEGALNRSLRRLGTDYVDIYMIHWPRRAGDPNWKERLAETYQKMMEENASVQSYFKESIDGIATVKAANVEDEIRNGIEKRFTRFIEAAFKNGF